MACCFKEYNLNQAFLLPPSMRDWLPEGDLEIPVHKLRELLNVGDDFEHLGLQISPELAHRPWHVGAGWFSVAAGR